MHWQVPTDAGHQNGADHGPLGGCKMWRWVFREFASFNGIPARTSNAKNRIRRQRDLPVPGSVPTAQRASPR